MLRQIDPVKQYQQHSPQRILESCGLIPQWMQAIDPTEPVKEQIEAMYGFGVLWEAKGGEVALNGAYKYPEDPILYPLVSWKWTHEGVLTEVFMYEYAMLTIRTNGKVFTTRVD